MLQTNKQTNKQTYGLERSTQPTDIVGSVISRPKFYVTANAIHVFAQNKTRYKQSQRTGQSSNTKLL